MVGVHLIVHTISFFGYATSRARGHPLNPLTGWCPAALLTRHHLHVLGARDNLHVGHPVRVGARACAQAPRPRSGVLTGQENAPVLHPLEPLGDIEPVHLGCRLESFGVHLPFPPQPRKSNCSKPQRSHLRILHGRRLPMYTGGASHHSDHE